MKRSKTTLKTYIYGQVIKSGEDNTNARADVFGKSHTITLNNSSPMDIDVSSFIQIHNDNIVKRSSVELTN